MPRAGSIRTMQRRKPAGTRFLRWCSRDGDRRTQFLGKYSPRSSTPYASEEQIQWFNDLQKITTSPANAYKLALRFGQIDVRHLLNEVRVPTLVLHARGDFRVKFTKGQELASHIANARFVPLESRNHVLLGTEAAWPVFVEEVRTFLATLRGA